MKPLPKVFVVDDDPAVLSSIEAHLTAQSYDVQCFASAEEFIAQHHPTHVGCVVIDLSAPGMGGSELIRHLHETQQPVVRCHHLGIDRFGDTSPA